MNEIKNLFLTKKYRKKILTKNINSLFVETINKYNIPIISLNEDIDIEEEFSRIAYSSIPDKIKKILESSKDYIFLINSNNKKYVIFRNSNYISLFSDNNIYYYDNNFKNIFLLKNAINIYSYKEEKEIIFNNAIIRLIKGNSYFDIKNSLFEDFELSINLNKLNENNTFSIKKNNYTNEVFFGIDTQKNYILFSNIIQCMSFESKTIKSFLNKNYNFSDLLIGSFQIKSDLKEKLDLQNIYHNTTYSELLELITDKLEIYSLTNDIKLNVLDQKEYDIEINRLKFFIDHKKTFDQFQINCSDIIKEFYHIENEIKESKIFSDIFKAEENFIFDQKEINKIHNELMISNIILLHKKNKINFLDETLISKIKLTSLDILSNRLKSNQQKIIIN